MCHSEPSLDFLTPMPFSNEGYKDLGLINSLVKLCQGGVILRGSKDQHK